MLEKYKKSLKKNHLTEFLVDAPCSGFGVMRRKPDIKYTKTRSDIERLSTIQHAIIKAVAPLLKKVASLYIVHVQ